MKLGRQISSLSAIQQVLVLVQAQAVVDLFKFVQRSLKVRRGTPVSLALNDIVQTTPCSFEAAGASCHGTLPGHRWGNISRLFDDHGERSGSPGRRVRPRRQVENLRRNGRSSMSGRQAKESHVCPLRIAHVSPSRVRSGRGLIGVRVRWSTNSRFDTMSGSQVRVAVEATIFSL